MLSLPAVIVWLPSARLPAPASEPTDWSAPIEKVAPLPMLSAPPLAMRLAPLVASVPPLTVVLPL